ncbi:MAG: CaiB/BaiF CoA-transferase family protein [Dehalococcoidia bacterium]|nr:CaiB/BaiF CoA-transferase family protein [Dehalococcoidia bacterium]
MPSTIHQNKEAIVVDWRTKEGAHIVKELSRRSDVLVENFAKGILEKSGLGHHDLCRENPGLVYVSITGFGHTGPLCERTAFDIIAQATGGIMWAQGSPGHPPGVFFADLVSGAYAAIGAISALWQRAATGMGQHVDISMQDVMYFHNFWAFADRANGPERDEVTSRLGRTLESFLTDQEHPLPFWNSYRARDGYIVIVALTDEQWNRFMTVIGKPELIRDARFNNLVARVRNADEGVAIISAWISERTTDEVERLLIEMRIPCGKVKDFGELFTDPQLRERGMFQTAPHPKLGPIESCGFPVKMSGADLGVVSACPDLGQDTATVLKELLGYDDGKIAELRERKAIL